MNWTPGPWTVTTDNAGGGANICAGKVRIGWTVFVPAKGSNEPLISEDEAKANARLISLAPELAEALKAFLEWTDGGHWPKGAPNPPTLPANLAHALLAKLEKQTS